MSAQFRDDLPPEVYPLAWLVGEWRGQGTVGYGPIKPGRIRQEIRFEPADGPYLAYQARTWLHGDQAGNPADAAASPPSPAPGAPSSPPPGPNRSASPGDAPGPPPAQPPADQPDPNGQPEALWHQEAGFWRVTPGQTQIDPPFEIEVLISDAAGYQSLYLGQIDGPRIDLATDAVIRTASAPEVNAATRMYGLVAGDLLWAWDIAGFGHRLGSYMAARLGRAAD
ncbi:MAG: FABP family protein [Bifidobacteriaceae bacterium]|jgi:hypothetical protein|nr:FABP family protein [Bifidobacteriaceae bacterium]